MSEYSLRNTLAFRPQWLRFSNFLQTIALFQYSPLLLYKDLRILYSYDKRKLSNGQLWKIWKETALIELCSFFIDILAFELVKLCPEVGILLHFFDPGARVLHWKAIPGAGVLMEKISGPGGDGNQSNWYLHYFQLHNRSVSGGGRQTFNFRAISCECAHPCLRSNAFDKALALVSLLAISSFSPKDL